MCSFSLFLLRSPVPFPSGGIIYEGNPLTACQGSGTRRRLGSGFQSRRSDRDLPVRPPPPRWNDERGVARKRYGWNRKTIAEILAVFICRKISSNDTHLR